MKHILVLLSVLISLSSCYTIHFTKTSNLPQEYEFTKWHHIGLAGLLEFSPPVNLKEICSEEGDWSAVRVQTGFVQGLVRMVGVPIYYYPYYIGIGNFYSPEQVSTQCVANNPSSFN